MHGPVLAHLRYVDLSADVAVDVLGRGTTLQESHRWIDPVVGLVVAVPVGERWSISLRADIGGFGVGSEFA